MAFDRPRQEPASADLSAVLRIDDPDLSLVDHGDVDRLDLELQRLQKLGYSIVSASLDGKDFREFTSWPEKQVLVIGNEANGVSEAVKLLTDRLVRIPHSGSKPGVESLNASVSAAILMERMVL